MKNKNEEYLSSLLKFIDSIDLTELEKEKTSVFCFCAKVSFDISLILPLISNFSNYLILKKNVPYEFFAGFGSAVYFDSNSAIQDILSKIQIISTLSKEKQILLPLILGGVKFPAYKTGETWQNFNDNNFFIPRFLFYQSSDGLLLATYFSADVHSFVAVKEELLNSIVSMFENIFSNSKVQSIQKLHNAAGYTTLENEQLEFIKWKTIVNIAVDKISSEKIEKVVLARKKRFKFNFQIDLCSFFVDLSTLQEDSAVILFGNDGSNFLCASPEKLITSDGLNFTIDCLAGSIKRSSKLDEDNTLANELKHSIKNISEHNYVVNYIISTLKAIGIADFQISETVLRKLRNIQHLHTVISGSLAENESIIKIACSLFPTPAVCGTPKFKAIELISKLEDFERGLYGGFLGWFNQSNAGEFFVGIRSAVIHNDELVAYAGCGIVKESDPEEEFFETELKFKTITSIFEDESK